MDSGRLALLEKAREFGSLAQNMTFQDFLDKSVTYRTLALFLGIHKEWWGEFWRSFSFAQKNDGDDLPRRFRFCCRAQDLPFLTMFLACWFGKDTYIKDIPAREFERVYRLAMRTDRVVENGGV